MPDIVANPADYPRAFEAALNEGNLERIVALYEEEAVLRVQSDEIHAGSAAIRAEMQQLIMAKAQIRNTLRHALRHGDVALLVVDYVLELTTPNATNPVSLTGTATNVVRRHAQEGWRMIIANPQAAA